MIDDFNDPDGAGPAVHRRPAGQRRAAVRRRARRSAAAVLRAAVHLLPRRRRTEAAAGDLQPADARRARSASSGVWELAGTKTGGYLYPRALLALLSAVFHWIVFQSLGTAAPVALALWVGIVSQFLPVVGTYLAGVLPVLLTFLDSPVKALIVLIAIVVYQQIENYLLSPRITAHTMELHPALAFGAALGGAAVLGAVGAVLALPAAAMGQAIVSEWGDRHEVIKSELTEVRHPRVWKRWSKIRKAREASSE